MDGPSVRRYRWPWRRTRIAQLIQRLKADGARVIALDMVFSDPSPKEPGYDLSNDDRVLAAALSEAGNVVLGYFFRRDRLTVNQRACKARSTAASWNGGAASPFPAALASRPTSPSSPALRVPGLLQP